MWDERCRIGRLMITLTDSVVMVALVQAASTLLVSCSACLQRARWPTSSTGALTVVTQLWWRRWR